MCLREWTSCNPPALLGHLQGHRREMLSLSHFYNVQEVLRTASHLSGSKARNNISSLCPPPPLQTSTMSRFLSFQWEFESDWYTHHSGRPSGGSGDQLEAVRTNTWSHLTWWRKTEQENSAGSQRRRIISDICFPKSERSFVSTPWVVTVKSVLKSPAAGRVCSWICTLANIKCLGSQWRL